MLGSSLQIQPANKLPTYSAETVIINLSKTKMDKKANIIINGKCDHVMKKIMEKLQISVSDWKTPIDAVFQGQEVFWKIWPQNERWTSYHLKA